MSSKQNFIFLKTAHFERLRRAWVGKEGDEALLSLNIYLLTEVALGQKTQARQQGIERRGTKTKRG